MKKSDFKSDKIELDMIAHLLRMPIIVYEAHHEDTDDEAWKQDRIEPDPSLRL